MIIAIAGNVGSGKTTLAKYISKDYSFHYIPQRRFEFDFIDDFFDDIEGKFFPAQVSFLLSKAIEIQELSESKENIVIDRSLLEDIEVFARLWIENRDIDEKIVQLYHHTAKFIMSVVPNPDLYIICRCPSEVSAQRISHRKKRSFEDKYPPNHIQLIADYYSKLTIKEGVPSIEIDTTLYDFSNPSVLEKLCELLFSRIEDWHTYDQISLFDVPVETEKLQGVIFRDFNTHNRPVYANLKQSKDKEYVYLAAPFSQFATEQIVHSQNIRRELSLFSDLIEERSYSELPLQYRNRLTRIARAIEKRCGLPVMLPHRDINDWGKTPYDSHYLTPKIINAVKHAAALVAIPGSSIGVHMEIGVAVATGIPIVIFETEDLSSSFFVDGLSDLKNIMRIKVTSTNNIASYIEKERVLDFIFQNRGRTE